MHSLNYLEEIHIQYQYQSWHMVKELYGLKDNNILILYDRIDLCVCLSI